MSRIGIIVHICFAFIDIFTKFDLKKHYSAHLRWIMNKEQLGALIKERRNFLGITQKELAEISGVTLRKLGDIENGKANPTLDTLVKVFEVIGLQIKVEIKS